MTTKFLLTRSSNYIKSVFDPKRGAFSSPDDRTVRHMTRQETITSTLTASDKGGCIIIMPNSCATIKGWHYIYTGTAWTLQNTISLAQDITDNYNYGRQTAMYMDIRAATQSTSNAILSGTMNAVTYEGGGMSELGLQTYTGQTLYNSILATTSNGLDKVGNVFGANGISVLSLPNDADMPYTRLGDISPSSNCVARYVDKQQNLGLQVLPNQASWALTTTDQTLYSYNLDAGIQQWDKTINFSVNTTATVTFTIRVLDVFGNLLYSAARSANVDGSTGTTVYFDGLSSLSPTCAVEVRARASVATTLNGASSNVVVWSGSEYGKQSPITLIAYNGFIAGTAMTVSGVANLELVPNTALLRQVKTTYGPYDPHEFEYFKTLLGMRDSLQLRTVMSTATYLEMKNLWVELGELDKNTVAEAFDLGSLIRGIKAVAAPALSAFIPGAAPIIGALSPLIDTAIDTLTPKASAASGPAYIPGGVAWAMDSPMSSDIELLTTSDQEPEVQPIIPGQISVIVGSEMAMSSAMFPVVITAAGVPTEMKMYCLFKIHPMHIPDWKSRVSPDLMSKITKKSDIVVYGVDSEVPRSVKGPGTFIALPIVHYDCSQKTVVAETSGPTVMGTSWQAALALLAKTQPHCYPYPITGGVATLKSGDEVILENPAYPVKFAYCRRMGLPLIGVDMGMKCLNMKVVISRMNESSKPCELEPYRVRMASNYKQVAWAAGRMSNFMSNLNQTSPPMPPQPRPRTTVVSQPTMVDATPAVQVEPTLEALGASTRPAEPVMDANALAETLDQVQTLPEQPRLPPPIIPRKSILKPVIPERSELGAMSVVADTERAGELPAGTTEVMMWIVKSGLIPSLFQMSKLDPQGMLTYRTLRPLHEIGQTSSGSVTPATAMYNSAAAKAKNLAMQYRGIDVDWVIANGNRGPDDTQIAYYKNNGVMPPPGTNQGAILHRPSNQAEALQARGTTKLDAKIENIMRSDAYSTPWLYEELKTFGEKYGRIPNTEELKLMRDGDPERPGRIEEYRQGRVKAGAQKNYNVMPTQIDTKYYTVSNEQYTPPPQDQPVQKKAATSKGRASRFLAGLRGNTGLQ